MWVRILSGGGNMRETLVRSVCAVLVGFICLGTGSPEQTFRLPTLNLIATSKMTFPADTDSNSPAFWKNGKFHIIVSNERPRRAVGPSLEELGTPQVGSFLNASGLRWIEGVFHRQHVTYGIYHLETTHTECEGRPYYRVPEIGLAKSYDDGLHWIDLGIVLSESIPDLSCEATINRFFPGSVGDPSWYVDVKRGYAYILFSAYSQDIEQQGVQIARIAISDFESPVGKVWRWTGNMWDAPGLNGAGQPVLKPENSWHSHRADGFWGPSVHYNTYLEAFVILMSRTLNHDFDQDGNYVAYATDIGNPLTWTTPRKFLSGEESSWYPQVIGAKEMRGTDSLAGQTSRLFLHGQSEWLLHFEK